LKGLNLGDYIDDLRLLFNTRDDCSQDPGVVLEDNEAEKNNQAAGDKKAKERGERLSDENTWTLAKAIMGTREGISKPKNKAIAEFLKKHPTLTKRQVDRRAKEISINVYLVDPTIFEDLVSFIF